MLYIDKVIIEDEEFQKAFFEITGESSTSIIAYARTITDPWSYIAEVKEETVYLSVDYPAQYDAFVERADEFLATVDASLETKRALSENQDRWLENYDPNAETRWLNYNPRDMMRDIWGINPVMFYTESRLSKDTRAEWKRITKDQPASMRMLTEYGNFDIGITERASRAALRVRTQVRKGEPYLSIGAIQINMNTGRIICGVYGCKHTGQLSNRPSQSNPEKPDREWQEYQVLRIIEHLGTHDKKSTGKQFPVFVQTTKPQRDSDAEKMLGHWRWCTNAKCEC